MARPQCLSINIDVLFRQCCFSFCLLSADYFQSNFTDTGLIGKLVILASNPSLPAYLDELQPGGAWPQAIGHFSHTTARFYGEIKKTMTKFVHLTIVLQSGALRTAQYKNQKPKVYLFSRMRFTDHLTLISNNDH